jgi:flagellar biosynthesis regulator FlbT
MPLKLTLNRGEKVVINGCLIAADANKIKLSIESPADIIRESEIISEADVDTPIKQLAANIQKLLVFPDYPRP